MSNSDRDQRHRLRSNKHCPESQNGGCPACHTGEHKRPARKKLRAGKTRAIREQLA